MDKERIEKAVREILFAIGEDPEKHLQICFQDEKYDELVLVKDIPFYSMCEHHLDLASIK